MVWRNVVNALIGIWFIISPVVLGYSVRSGQMVTTIIGGIILLVLAGSAALADEARGASWIQYITGLVGIWFIFAPWVLSFVNRPGEFWMSFILGIIALVLSAWSLASVPRTAEPPAKPQMHS